MAERNTGDSNQIETLAQRPWLRAKMVRRRRYMKNALGCNRTHKRTAKYKVRITFREALTRRELIQLRTRKTNEYLKSEWKWKGVRKIADKDEAKKESESEEQMKMHGKNHVEEEAVQCVCEAERERETWNQTHKPCYVQQWERTPKHPLNGFFGLVLEIHFEICSTGICEQNKNMPFKIECYSIG